MKPARSKLSLKPQPALIARRVMLHHEKLVYVLVTNKKLTYKQGKSRIVYIGTTKKGGARIAQSVAFRSQSVLRAHGVISMEARIVTCRGRKHVRMWMKLERAMLIEFRSLFGSVPRCNNQGKNFEETDEFEYFARQAVRKRLLLLS